jgi:hypothetical protein
VQRSTDASGLVQLHEAGVRGLVTGSLNLADYERVKPSFAVVVTEGFGDTAMADELWDIFEAHAGKPAALDARTQLRAGVVRPRVVLPDA